MSIRAFPSADVGYKWQAWEQNASVKYPVFCISKAIQTTEVLVGVRSSLAN